MKLRRAIAGGVLGLAVAGAPASVPAQEGPDAPASLPAEADTGKEAAPDPAVGGAELEAYWERRLSHARQRIALARERAAKAEADYSRARHDGHPRGEALDEIKERHDAALTERREAEAALPRLVELARRAGVAPGVLREFWDEDAELADDSL